MLLVLLAWLTVVPPISAQGAGGDRLVVGTVTRAPFSLVEDGRDIGFGLDLWAAIADELGLLYDIRRYDGFPEMLADIESGATNAAVANISITADREERMDFSQPIFSAGLQILLPPQGGGLALVQAALTPRLIGLTALALGVLLALGMLMWLVERRHHDVFGRSAREATFPAFWWALNLMLNGEQVGKAPRSALGRLLGVVMVVGSLFVVSIFVASVTANLTLDALEQDVGRVTDLDGRRVGTTEGSTASSYLNGRGVAHRTFPDFQSLIAAFETGAIEAVVFDGPILAYWLDGAGAGRARLVDRVFQPEYYGIALPPDSPLREPINRTLLRLEEDGTYGDLVQAWFGASYAAE